MGVAVEGMSRPAIIIEPLSLRLALKECSGFSGSDQRACYLGSRLAHEPLGAEQFRAARKMSPKRRLEIRVLQNGLYLLYRRRFVGK